MDAILLAWTTLMCCTVMATDFDNCSYIASNRSRVELVVSDTTLVRGLTYETWYGAQRICSCLGGKMATLADDSVNVYHAVADTMARHFPGDVVWIGGKATLTGWARLPDYLPVTSPPLGCFQGHASLEEELQSNSAEVCISWCKFSLKKDYAGLKGTYCYCFQDISHLIKVDMNKCVLPCPGDSKERCGGRDSLTVHAAMRSTIRWGMEEPPAVDSGRHCAYVANVRSGELVWYAQHCQARHSYICRFEGSSKCSRGGRLSSCLIKFPEPRTWNEADYACAKQGGYIADIAPYEKQIALGNNVYWVGLTRQRTVWTDGTRALFGRWTASSNRNRDDGCLGLWQTDSGMAMTIASCEGKHQYLCVLHHKLTTSTGNQITPASTVKISRGKRIKSRVSGTGYDTMTTSVLPSNSTTQLHTLATRTEDSDLFYRIINHEYFIPICGSLSGLIVFGVIVVALVYTRQRVKRRQEARLDRTNSRIYFVLEPEDDSCDNKDAYSLHRPLADDSSITDDNTSVLHPELTDYISAEQVRLNRCLRRQNGVDSIDTDNMDTYSGSYCRFEEDSQVYDKLGQTRRDVTSSQAMDMTDLDVYAELGGDEVWKTPDLLDRQYSSISDSSNTSAYSHLLLAGDQLYDKLSAIQRHVDMDNVYDHCVARKQVATQQPTSHLQPESRYRTGNGIGVKPSSHRK